MRISVFFFFSSRRRHTRCSRDWSSDVCSSDLSPQFVFRLARSGDIFRMNRPLLELLAEIQQHLCQLARRIQPVCPRSVVPLLVPCQFELQTQILNVQIVSTLLLAVTLGKQRTQHRFQRCAVLSKLGKSFSAVCILPYTHYHAISYLP